MTEKKERDKGVCKMRKFEGEEKTSRDVDGPTELDEESNQRRFNQLASANKPLTGIATQDVAAQRKGQGKGKKQTWKVEDSLRSPRNQQAHVGKPIEKRRKPTMSA